MSSAIALSSKATLHTSTVPFATEIVDSDLASQSNRVVRSSQYLLVIDEQVHHYHTLIDGALDTPTIVILDRNRDGIKQITEAIEAYVKTHTASIHAGALAIHIISHGTPGTLYLGNTKLSLETCDQYAPQLQNWFKPGQDTAQDISETLPATLYFYGCNTAATPTGIQFLQQLHRLTGAAIYASNTLTGHADLGGDWKLDVCISATKSTQTAPLPFHPLTLNNYPAVLAPGDPDLSFSADGITTLDFNGGNDFAQSVVVQPDGKIVVAGYAQNGATEDFALTRFNADGTLDTSFGTAGKVMTPVGTSTDRAFSLSIQPDGKLVVAGYSTISGSNDFALVRYNSNGTLDTSFGTGGKTTTPLNGDDGASSVIVQPDGKILVAGQTAGDFALVRYNSNGTLDTSFGTSGKVSTSVSGIDIGESAIVQSDGKIVVAGYTINGSDNDFALTRYNSNGTLDTSFGSGGKVTLSIAGFDRASSVLVQPDGKLVVTGYTSSGSGSDFALARYNSNGTLDSTFGTGGIVTTPVGSANDESYSAVIQSDGKILVSGFADSGGNDFALVRYNSNGTLDSTFGTGGKVINPGTAANETAYHMAVQSDGNIVLVGQVQVAGQFDFGVVRYLGDAPAIPVITGITDDTATAGDGITNDPQIVISGTAPANSTVNLYQNGGTTPIASVTAGANGIWSYDYTGTTLADGNYTFTATATISGNTSPVSAGYAVTVDTTIVAPAITAISSDSGVLPNDGITNDPTLVLTGTAEANSKVDVYRGATFLGTVTADTSGNWSYDHTAISLADNTYSFKATATDRAGNTRDSALFNVTIDTLVPAAPVVTGISGDSGTANDGITNDPTLIINGTAEANSRVQVFVDNTLVSTVNADGTGTWTYDYSGTTLATGAHTIKAVALDAAGNISPDSAIFNVTIDTIAPVAPVITGISDDSNIAGDGITNDNTLIIRGTAEANSSVQIFSGTTPIGSPVTTDALGNWSFDYTGTPLTEGSYNFKAVATDAAGNASPDSNIFAVTVDRTAPAIPTVGSITSDSGTPGDSITNDNTLVINGNADAGSKIDVYRNGIFVGSTTANGSGVWNFDYQSTVLPDGTHNFTATATDTAGNISAASPALVVKVDTGIPAAPAVASITSDSGTAGDGITNDNTLTIAGTAEANSVVNVLLDGSNIGTATADATGNWTYAYATVIADGSHILTATATDAAGNVSPTSANFNITVDTGIPAAPAITSFSTDTGVVGDNRTNDKTISLTGTTEANGKVTITRNGTAIGNATADGTGNWSFNDPTTLLDNAYTYSATVTDTAGNISTATDLVITVDATAPVAPVITSITDDTGTSATDRITSDRNLFLNGTAEANSKVEIFQGTTSLGIVNADGTGNWQLDYTATTLTDGNYNFTAKATDAAGNISPASTIFTVTIDSTAPVAPAITSFNVDSNVAGDRITNDQTIVLAGTAAANSLVAVFHNGTQVGTATATLAGNWTYDFTGTTLTNGDHTFKATATDTAGNISADSANFVITVDATAPAAPSILSISDDTGSSAADGVTSDTRLILNGTAEANSKVQILRDGTVAGTTTTNASGAWTFDYTATALGNATYNFTAIATDIAGNSSPVSTAFQVTVDTIAPPTPIISTITDDTGTSTTDRITKDNTLVLNGTAQANSTVELFVNGTAIPGGTALVDGTGNWSFNYTGTTLPDGVYNFTARAIDLAGNISGLTSAFQVTVDTIAPPTPTITNFSNDTGNPDGITSDNTLQIAGTAEANRIVDVYVDGVLAGTTTANATGNWSYNIPTVIADGTHAFTAVARDVAGNNSAVSAALNVTVDTTKPAQPIIAAVATDSGIPTDRITNDKTLTLSGTAEANSRVQVFLGTTSIGIVSADASGNWNIDTGTPLADGTYTFTAKATDTAGNIGDLSTAFNVTIDATAPVAPTITTITDDTGTPSDRITNDNTLIVKGTAEKDSTVQVLINGVAVGTTTTDGTGNWSFDYTATTLGDGNYTLTARATDVAGNQGAASTAFNITIDTTAPVAPSITSITEDTNTAADGITSDTTLILTGKAEANSVVTILRDGTLIGTATTSASGNWSFDYTGTSLADNTYVFTATATDTANNTSAASVPFNVIVDTTPPAAPEIVAITNDTNTLADRITNDNTLILNGTAEANSKVTVLMNGTAIGTTTTNATGTWSFDYTSTVLADNVYVFSATATDAAGNTSSASAAFNVTVDTTAPIAPVISSFSDDTGATGDGITGDNTLTLTGTAEANSVVTISDNSSVVTTVNADATGNWTYTTATLTDGNHSFTTTATDAAGNVSAASLPLNVVVDTGIPAAPTVDAITDDSNIAADGITNDNLLTITGTAEANSVVTVLLDNTVIGTANTDATGKWSFDYTTVINDGTHSLTARATDAANNTSADSAAFTLQVDTVKPTKPTVDSIADDTDTPGDEITSDNTLTINGTAETNSQVALYLDGSLIATVTTDGAGNWTYDYTTAIADGSHQFTVTATDAAGNISDLSDPLNVTIDTAAPVAPVVSTISDDTGTPSDGITNDNLLTVNGTAEANSIVSVYLDGGLLSTVTADATGNWSFNYTTVISDGNHQFTATATDAAGNVSTVSAPLDILVDTVAPAAPTISSISDDTDTPADGITSDNTLTFNGTAEENSTVTLSLDGTAIGTATTDAFGNWTFAYDSVIADGNHSLTVTATDAANNTSIASTPFNITIDTAKPAAPAISTISDDTATAGDGITSDNTLSMSGTGEANSTIDLYLDGSWIGSIDADGTGNWTFNYSATPLADSSYALTATATDASGNISDASAAFNVTIDSTPPAAPVITGISDDNGAAGDGITNDTTLVFTGTAEANSTVQLTLDGNPIATATADASGNWSYDYTGTLLPAGAHTLTATATDAAGNISDASAPFNITIDTDIPAAPVISAISDDTELTTDGITTDNTLIFNGTAEANSTIELFQNDVLVNSTMTDAAGNWQFDYSGTVLADGTYQFTAQAIDAAGNRSTASSVFQVIVDTTAPNAPVITGISDDTGTVGDGLTQDNQLFIHGTSEANATIRVYRDSLLLNTVTADAAGNWSFDYTSIPLADGTYTFGAQAVDAAGNVSAESVGYVVTTDIVAPDAPIITGMTTDSGIATDNITNDPTLTLSGTAEANSTIEVFQNGTSVGTTTTDASGNWTFDHTNTSLTDNTYVFTAKAIDRAGNVSVASSDYSVTIDTTPPQTPTITAISNDSGSVGDGITNDTTLVLTGTALADSTIDLLKDGIVIGSANADASGNWAFDHTAVTLIDGVHSFTARAKDVADNTITSAALAMTIDTTAPSVNLTSDAPAETTQPFTVTATFSEKVTGFTATDLTIGNGSISNFTPISDTVYSFTVNPTGDGTITVDLAAAVAEDLATNANTAAARLTRILDTTAPTVPPVPALAIGNDTGASSNDGIINLTTPTFTGTAEAGSTIELFAGTTSLGKTTTDAAGNWSFKPTSPLADGDYNISVTATDRLSNTSAASGALKLRIDTQAVTGVVVQVIPDARDSTIDSTVGSINIRFSEAVARLDLADVSLTRNGSPIDLTGAALSTTDNVTWTLNNLGTLTGLDGEYKLTVKTSDVIDWAGNLLASDADTTWLVGRTGTALPPIKFTRGKRGVKRQGTNRNEKIRGTWYDDILKGGGGDDRISSGYGKAKYGRDVLDGGAGNDQLLSGSGRDILRGGSGNDYLSAGEDDDQLLGGSENDALLGQEGSDVLTGGTGNDTLTGGVGRDTFVFTNLNEGVDTITDFEGSRDLIDLRQIFARSEFAGGTPFARFHQFVQLKQVETDTQIRIDADGNGSGNRFETLFTCQNTSINTIGSINFVIV